MKIRPYSHLGWPVLQLLGASCLPSVTRDVQSFWGRRAGKMLDLTEGLGEDTEVNLHPAQERWMGS